MDVFSSFQPTDVLSSFSLTDVVPSTFWRPSTNFHFPADVLLRSPPTDDFSRFPPTDDLKRTFPRLFRKITKKIDVFLRFFDISAYRRFFRDFRLPTTFIGPSNIFKKKTEKKRRLSKIFRFFHLPTSFWDFRPPTTFRRPSDVFLKKHEKNIYPAIQHGLFWSNFKKNIKNFVYRQPTDDLPKFPPTDDLQGSSWRLFKKNAKKIDVYRKK